MKICLGYMPIVCALLLLSACTKVGLEKPVVDKVKVAKLNTELGLQYLALGKLSMAKIKLDKAYANVRLPETEIALGLYFKQVREVKVAQQHFLAAIAMESNPVAAYMQYAIFLCEQQECKVAYKYFDLATADLNYTELGKVYTAAVMCARSCGDLVLAGKYQTRALDYTESQD